MNEHNQFNNTPPEAEPYNPSENTPNVPDPKPALHNQPRVAPAAPQPTYVPHPPQQAPNIIIQNIQQVQSVHPTISHKSRLVTLLLAFFFGFLGVHRFYAGKIGTGILYFLTMGFLGLGILADIISILLGNFRDAYGLPIQNW